MLKTFQPQNLPDRGARDRFLKEGTTWVELGRHPHIVRCYDVIYPGTSLEVYLVLELVDGTDGKRDTSLCSWLDSGKPLRECHTKREPRRPRLLFPSVLVVMEEAVEWCMKKSPQGRPSDWEQLQGAIGDAYFSAVGKEAPAEVGAEEGVETKTERIAAGWSYNAIGVSYL